MSLGKSLLSCKQHMSHLVSVKIKEKPTATDKLATYINPLGDSLMSCNSSAPDIECTANFRYLELGYLELFEV